MVPPRTSGEGSNGGLRPCRSSKRSRISISISPSRSPVVLSGAASPTPRSPAVFPHLPPPPPILGTENHVLPEPQGEAPNVEYQYISVAPHWIEGSLDTDGEYLHDGRGFYVGFDGAYIEDILCHFINIILYLYI